MAIQQKLFDKQHKESVYRLGKKNYIKLIGVISAENNISSPEYDVLLTQISDIELPSFDITGKKLLSMGCSPGKQLGDIIKTLENIWIQNDYKISDHEIEMHINQYKN